MKKYLLIIAFLLNTTIVFAQESSSKDDGRHIRIPIVFHVLYGNGKENISDSLILNELRDLNLDFSKKNDMSLLDSDFKSIVGNPNIEFYLVDTIFNGSGLRGVNRISSSTIQNKYLEFVDPKNCLNVIIANGGNASDILSDRVNLNYRDVGLHSHVLTHETGHWLGLYHIFGKIGSSSWWRVAFGDRDDLIDDTPEQKGASAVCYDITPKCPCPPKNIYYKKHKVLYNNFMDYNPCRCVFTIGQSTKMRNNIIDYKPLVFENSK